MVANFNQIVWEIESDIDKNLKILNDNNTYIKEFADKIPSGVLLFGTTSANVNISATPATTNIFSDTFWLGSNDRIVKMSGSFIGWYCTTGGYPYTQSVYVDLYIDGILIQRLYGDTETITATDYVSTFANKLISFSTGLSAGNHTIDIYATKTNGAITTPFSFGMIIIEDVGGVIAES